MQHHVCLHDLRGTSSSLANSAFRPWIHCFFFPNWFIESYNSCNTTQSNCNEVKKKNVWISYPRTVLNYKKDCNKSTLYTGRNRITI